MASYPLEQLTLIKKRRLEEAEKVLQDKKNAQAKEEQKLAELSKERDLVKEHREDKLAQLRHELDSKESTTTSAKIQQMKYYLKEVEEKLQIKENKVKEQQKQVDKAIQAVEVARQDMLKKQQAVEKMQLHKKEWEKEQMAEQDRLDSLINDELGTVSFLRRKAEQSRDLS
ncbi:MAG: type III secretion T3S chaperone [Chlamydiae bacterium]|nr:type III secretion T3S chaperone [Chlamydiota bacterium]